MEQFTTQDQENVTQVLQCKAVFAMKIVFMYYIKFFKKIPFSAFKQNFETTLFPALIPWYKSIRSSNTFNILHGFKRLIIIPFIMFM